MQLSHRTENVLFILDGHSSHTKNTRVIDKARDNKVVIISLLSHCTHRLQFYYVSVFKCVNANYNRVVHIWFRQYPGRSVVELQIATLFGSAYNKAVTMRNAVNGFRVCGINPFNPHIFSDDDFAAADVTDKPADLPDPQPNATSAGDLADPQTNATSVGGLADPPPATIVQYVNSIPPEIVFNLISAVHTMLSFTAAVHQKVLQTDTHTHTVNNHLYPKRGLMLMM